MNKKLKIKIGFIVCLLVVGVIIVHVIEKEKQENSVTKATGYAESVFQEVIDSLTYNKMFLDRITNPENLALGEPFIIWHVEKEAQDEVYYYPIIDRGNERVVYLLEVIGLSDGYTCGTLDDLVDVLNEIDYINNSCVVYSVGDIQYVESEHRIINVYEYYNKAYLEEEFEYSLPEDEAMCSMSFEKKKRLISERMGQLKVVGN